MARLQLSLISILSVCVVTFNTQEAPEEPEVSEPHLEVEPTQTIFTGSGPLQGRKVTTAAGSSHYEYLGIPFAEPPTGRRRFRAPLPVQPWQEVLEANQDGSPCLQPITGFEFGETSGMSEDCLTLNIFTTTDTHHQNKPVMFWIHGGGFSQGSKDQYRMRGLIEEDVVLVTTNYRLHALGFLSFGNSLVSGNMGLQDQHLALQWVRHNIHRFGGDPGRITIFGESAGAMSVQAQVLSPHNIGLLGGAIAQSGSILSLSTTQPGVEVEAAENVLEALGCPKTRDWTSLDCLQGLNMETMIVNITDDFRSFMDPNIESKFQFSPVIDSYASNPFLPLDPLEALKTGQFNQVPYMSGIVKNEGVLMTGGLRLAGITGSKVMEVVTQFDVGDGTLAMIGDENLLRIATRFYNHPTGDTDIEQEQPTVDLLTDTWFGSFDQKSVELMSAHTRNVYNYYLTQQTNNSLIAPMFNLPVEYTPMHGDDLAFLISGNKLEDTTNLSEEERETARLMVKYWSNFAKYGNPSPVGSFDVPTWYPVTPDRMKYLELKAEPEVGENLLADRMYFWEAMVWEEKENKVEHQNLYNRITELLSQPNSVY